MSLNVVCASLLRTSELVRLTWFFTSCRRIEIDYSLLKMAARLVRQGWNEDGDEEMSDGGSGEDTNFKEGFLPNSGKASH